MKRLDPSFCARANARLPHSTAWRLLGLLPALLAWGADPAVPVEPARNSFAADALVLPAGQPSVQPGEGAGLVVATCSQCHSLDYVTTQPALTRAQWTAGVEKMRTRFGASVPSNQVPILVEYLTRAYGTVPKSP
ncbi:MAG: sulfite:cytochrome C oxidoreductase subunit B [Verrucomicrobiota bacterium]